MPNRRQVLTSLAGALAGGAAASIRPKTALAAKTYKLRLTTSWSPKMPILQDAADRFSEHVKLASDGRVRIKVFAGGELIPPLEVFGAVSSGTIDMGISASYYWSGKTNAAPFFAAIPFGFTAQQLTAWLTAGGGQELWEELYAGFNLVPMSIGNSGMQMAGWFKQEINSVEDLKGLKMRIPGIGGQVMARCGTNVVLMPGGELYTALERGTIDATEWISPFHDERLGLYRAAKYYYYPGWHEPSANLELIVHKQSWAKLPNDIQQIIRSASAATGVWVISRSEAENGPALSRLTKEHGVQLRPLPAPVLHTLRKHSTEVVQELASKDAFSTKVYESYEKFRKELAGWSRIGEYAFADSLQ